MTIEQTVASTHTAVTSSYTTTEPTKMTTAFDIEQVGD